MSNDPNLNPLPTDPQGEPAQSNPSDASNESAESVQSRRKILIGSQRDPGAYKPKPKRDWIPSSEKKGEDQGKSQPGQSQGLEPSAVAPVESVASPAAPQPQEIVAAPVAAAPQPALESVVTTTETVGSVGMSEVAVAAAPVLPPSPAVSAPPAASPSPKAPAPTNAPASSEEAPVEGEGRRDRRRGRDRSREKPARPRIDPQMIVTKTVALPNLRSRLSPDLEQELEAALGDLSVEDLMAAGSEGTAQTTLEPEERQTARVVAVQRDDVFVELGGREQGILAANLFEETPQVGSTFEVVVTRFNAEDGLYELTLPNRASAVGDWSHISEGMLVEARVTGHNTGGLECEVNHLRGFIPISQIALYRVENLAEFVEQKFVCMVTEANPERRNLVLSRRAVLEREKEEAKRGLLESLAVGQIWEGVVRKLMDFGAFVDLGNGVDGLVHVSQLGWGRVKHPSEVLQEGQRIRVRIDKFDANTGRISLGYRELVEEDPWTRAEGTYLPNTAHHGRVVKVMDFGAFVQLEPGIEGLVHISELAHKRVARVNDVVNEGDEVDVMVLSVDPSAKRIGLSMKSLMRPPEPEVKPEPQAAEPAADAAAPVEPPKPKKTQPQKPLKGGLGRSGGNAFGLKW